MGYVLRRVVAVVPIWWVVASIVFVLVRLVPGDPVLLIAGTDASAEQVRDIRSSLGLDLPVYEQYVRWFGRLLHGDMGRSLFSREPVARDLLDRVPVSLQLALSATLVSVLIAIPAGVFAATRRNAVSEVAFAAVTMTGVCVPSFVMGLLLMLLLSVYAGLFPIRGYEPLSQGVLSWARYMALPAVAYGLIQAAGVARMTRATLLEVLGEDFIRTARAKGLAGWAVLYKHALRNAGNALIPVVTLIGLNVGVLFTGAVVIETLFGLPGLGAFLVAGILKRDYPIVQGAILFISTFLVLVNLGVDLLYRVIDPRLRGA
jgi:peptide/nickel transport system permease protein